MPQPTQPPRSERRGRTRFRHIRFLVAATSVAFAGFALAAASLAMSAGPVRSGEAPPSTTTPTPALAVRHSTSQPTTIVLLVADETSAERLRPNGTPDSLIASRGSFEVIVTIVRTRGEERLLLSMLLSDTICPTGTCGDVAILDLR